MMIYVIRIQFFFFLVTAPYLLKSQQSVPEDILFVGNSYTYFWNLPQTVDLFIESQNTACNADQSTAGGASLGHHWRGERSLKTKEIIASGNYDAIVLQDHSRRAIDHPDSLFLFGEMFAELINGYDADIYLYMTWAREWDPFMQVDIEEKYNELAEKIDAQIVPVGPAWLRARELRPGFPLYDDDGSHPSALGTYLTACVFFEVLTGNSSIGLTNRLVTKDINGEKLYLNIQSPENAIFCQKVAHEIVSQYLNNTDAE